MCSKISNKTYFWDSTFEDGGNLPLQNACIHVIAACAKSHAHLSFDKLVNWFFANELMKIIPIFVEYQKIKIVQSYEPEILVSSQQLE